MPDYSFSAYGINSVVFTGPNPFVNSSGRNMAALNNTILQVRTDARPVRMDVTDDDTHFHDATQEVGSASTLTHGETINGRTYPAGSTIQNEYTYILRPQGSNLQADNIRIHVMRIDGDIVGFAFSAPLVPGIPYVIRSGGSDAPGHSYSGLATVCFDAGTRIATPGGDRAAGDLVPCDLVLTRDNDPQPLAWVGGMCVAARGDAAPVRIRAGMLGATRDLIVSQQHRLLIRHGGEEALVAAKALVDGQAIRRQPLARVHYIHLMTESHEVIIANGVAAETFLPGPMARNWLDPLDRALVAGIAGDGGYPPARGIMRPGQWLRRARVRDPGSPLAP